MKNSWIALQSIPPGGSPLVLEDQSLWLDPIREFGLDCRILEPMRAEVLVLPQGDGVLFRGTLTGRVALPCDRCSDESIIDLSHSFDSFESYPAETLPVHGAGPARSSKRKSGKKEETPPPPPAVFDDVDETVIRNSPQGKGVEINPAALVWEEFSLALPVKPLCGKGCKGLCPVCGKNRNTEACDCAKDGGDPRLATLRGLTVNKK